MSINFTKNSIIKSTKTRPENYKFPLGVSADKSKPAINIPQGNIMNYLDTSQLGVYSNGQFGNWKIVDGPTGGNLIITYANTSQDYYFRSNQAIENIEILAIAGGGSGGFHYPQGGGVGGGGAGGVVYFTDNSSPYSNTGSAYFDVTVEDPKWTINVGYGGYVYSMSGQNTTIVGEGINILALGGGGGISNGPQIPSAHGLLAKNPALHGPYIGAHDAKQGGSGGGGYNTADAPHGNNGRGAGIPGQGFPGGIPGGAGGYGAGGGGGAGGAGEPGHPGPGVGGVGINLSISGSPVWYAAGGGSGGRGSSTLAKSPTTDAAGAGGLFNEPAAPSQPFWQGRNRSADCGLPNRGSGGGGFMFPQYNTHMQGSGGSGVVILSFPVLQNSMVTFESST